jgi:hypothetical protein
VIINSFNEWPEGSAIEPSQSYGNLYLDLTREWSARFKAADFAVQPKPSRQPEATPEPTPQPESPALPVALPETQWSSNRSMLERRCAYTLVDVGGLLQWVALCPSDSMPGNPSSLSY